MCSKLHLDDWKTADEVWDINMHQKTDRPYSNYSLFHHQQIGIGWGNLKDSKSSLKPNLTH